MTNEKEEPTDMETTHGRMKLQNLNTRGETIHPNAVEKST